MPRTSIRRFAPFLVLLVLVAAACGPTKPTPPPPPGALIPYYYSADNFGTGPFRSPAPHARQLVDNMQVPTGGTAAQALLPDGSVALGVEDSAGNNVDSGFWTLPVRFGDINTISARVMSGGDGVFIDLLFDRNGDGEFLTWDANGNWLSDNPDIRGAGQTEAQNLTITDSTQFFMNAGIGLTTLEQLKAGAQTGVGPNTRVVILVLLNTLGDTDGHTVVTSLRVNGVEFLVP